MNDSVLPPRPRAFRLDKVRETGAPMPAAEVEEQPDAFAPTPIDESEANIELAMARGFGRGMIGGRFTWASLLWTGVSGLISLAIGLWVTHLIEGLFAASSWVGWLALGLAGLAGLAALVLLGREIHAIGRQTKIAHLHARLAVARANDDTGAARTEMRELLKLYGGRAGMAKARAQIGGFADEIIDGRDLIDLAERHLMFDLDAQARNAVALAARRVSMVTALSPRAVLDVMFAAGQMIWLLRKIAEIYGGRPGLLGFFRLLRAVSAHLIITGGMALGDTVVQQLVGHGIAAKLSAKLGEGMLNGLLTARVGLAAMMVCRPMPFAVAPAPSLKDVVPDLFAGKLTAKGES